MYGTVHVHALHGYLNQVHDGEKVTNAKSGRRYWKYQKIIKLDRNFELNFIIVNCVVNLTLWEKNITCMYIVQVARDALKWDKKSFSLLSRLRSLDWNENKQIDSSPSYIKTRHQRNLNYMDLYSTVLFGTVVFFLCYSAMCNVGKLNSDLKPISKKYSGMKQLFFYTQN